MDTLRKQIRRAHRRLVLQSFASKLAWCWFATLLLAAAAIGVNKIWPMFDQKSWAIGSLATSVGAGLLVAVAWTWFTRQTAFNAAVEIDRRFGLKERVASTLALGPAELDTDIAQALVSDAVQRLDRIDVSDEFRMKLDRRALLPLLPAAIAAALVLFVDSRTITPPVQAATSESMQVKKSTQALAKRIDQQRKDAAEKGLKEVDAMLKQLGEETKNLAEKSQADRKQTLSALNDLVKDAEKRRQELASATDLKQQLNQLKNLQQGPAEKLGQALKHGDMKMAMQELDKLKEQLQSDKLSPEAKEQLAKQIEELQMALEKKADAQKQAQEQLKQKIESAKKEGNLAEADKMQQQLEKLMEKAPQMDKMAQMAQKLKQASEAMKQGDCKKAGDALGQMSGQMAEMQKEMEEMEMLDSALEQISDAKNAMTCKECQGEGCENCQGDNFKLSDKWSQTKNAKGGGVGAGPREEAKTDTQSYDSQVKMNVGKGASVFKGLADGPNRKGQVQEAIKGEFTGAQQQTAEALSGQKLPHEYRDHAKKYFDSLREGQK